MTKDFDARNEKKSRSVCTAMAESADTCKCALTDRERQILDIWPRFEDSEPVWLGDEVVDFGGEIVDIDFADKGVVIWDNACNHLHLAIGERVKRHVPEAMDADGVPIKVGDTVWHEDGSEWLVEEMNRYGVRCFDGGKRRTFDEKYLTHTRPDSWERLEEDAAKGPCEYFGSKAAPCDECPVSKLDVRCSEIKGRDIIRRAKKLAGVE